MCLQKCRASKKGLIVMSKKLVLWTAAIIFYAKLLLLDHDIGSYIGDGIFMMMVLWYSFKLDGDGK